MFELASSSDDEDAEVVEKTGFPTGNTVGCHQHREDKIIPVPSGPVASGDADDVASHDGSTGFMNRLSVPSMKHSTDHDEQRHDQRATDGDDVEADEKAPKRLIQPRSCPHCSREFTTQTRLDYHLERNVCGKDIQKIGRKARETLQNINSQRPVIRRVDPATMLAQERKSISILGPLAFKKRSRSVRPQLKQSTKLETPVRQDVDRWTPDTSLLLQACANQPRSNMIQLHGLPVDTTPEHIVGFFSGLSVCKVWMLPPLSQRVETWDANHSFHRKKGLHVERYPPYLRVLVKFRDTATAAMAVDRSGELLFMRHPIDAVDDDGDIDESQEVGVAIAVTQWTKDASLYVSRNQLVVDATSKAPLSTTLNKVQSALEPNVSQILWTAMIRDLALSLDVDTNSQFLSGLSTKPAHVILVGSAHEQAVQRYNEMLKVLDNLLLVQQCVYDPILMATDSVYRLTRKAIDVLKQDLSMIEHHLLQSRRLELLQSPWFQAPFAMSTSSEATT
ncbi:hypothetical protein MPSEU_000348200 [Mayamaea pseudoterrestris]|nr:hypothetical protein MPSEU_000348200 [Mayamaea pseudoterrestris]